MSLSFKGAKPYHFTDVLAKALKQETRRQQTLEQQPLRLTASSSYPAASIGSSTSDLTQLLSKAKAKWLVQQGVGIVAPYHVLISSAETWKDACKAVSEMIRDKVRPDTETFELVAERIAEHRRYDGEDIAVAARSAADAEIGRNDDVSLESNANVFPVDETSEEFRAFAKALAKNRERTHRRGSGDRRDHPLVMEFLKAQERSGVTPRVTTINALSEFRINWHMALQLLRYADERLHTVPMVETYDRAIEICAIEAKSVSSGRQGLWRYALKTLSAMLDKGVEPTLDTYRHTALALCYSVEAGSNPTTASGDAAKDDASTSPSGPASLLSPATPRLWRQASQLFSLVAHSSQSDKGLRIVGERGAVLLEQLSALSLRCMNWSMALSVLSKMDVGPIPTYRLLVPSADTYVYLMATLLRTRKLTMAFAIRTLFLQTYRFTDVSPPAVSVLLQTCIQQGLPTLTAKMAVPLIAELLMATKSVSDNNDDKAADMQDELTLQGALDRVKRWNQMLQDAPTRLVTADVATIMVRVLAMLAADRGGRCPMFTWNLALRAHQSMVHTNQFAGPLLLLGRALTRKASAAEAYHNHLQMTEDPNLFLNGWAFRAIAAANIGQWELGLYAVQQYETLPVEARFHSTDRVREHGIRACLHTKGNWQAAFRVVQQAWRRSEVGRTTYAQLLQSIALFPERRASCWEQAILCAAYAGDGDTKRLMEQKRNPRDSRTGTPPASSGDRVRRMLERVLADSPLPEWKRQWIVGHMAEIRSMMQLAEEIGPSSTMSRPHIGADFAAFW